MKRTKLFGCLIALGGMAVSFVTAFALYQKSAGELNVNIGPYQWSGATGDISYTVAAPTVTPTRNNQSHDAGSGYTVSGDYLLNETASFALGGSYAESTNIKHTVIAGLVSVTITIPTEYVNKVKAAVYMGGYADNTQGKRDYDATNLLGTKGGENATLSSTTTNASREVVVQNNGTQSINVYLDFTGLYAVDYLTLGSGLQYSVSVTFGEVTNESSSLHKSKLPVIKGDYNQWQGGEEYMMLPDITGAADGVKNRYVGVVAGLGTSPVTGKTYFSAFKGYKASPETWIGSGNDSVDGGNMQNTDGSHSLVYWTGENLYYLP